MAYRKLVALVAGLYRHTLSGDVVWKYALKGKGYRTKVHDFPIEIAFRKDVYYLTIFDESHREVEKVSSSELDEQFPIDSPDNHRFMMEEIFAAAKRQIIGTERVVNLIMMDLRIPYYDETEHTMKFR